MQFSGHQVCERDEYILSICIKMETVPVRALVRFIIGSQGGTKFRLASLNGVGFCFVYRLR